MAYRITLVDDIAQLGNWHGTRRRTCTFADGHKETLVFGRRPVVLAELPPEVKNDPKLVVEETDAAPTPSPAVEPPAAPPPPVEVIVGDRLPAGYAEFEVEDLRKLAAARGLDIKGNRYQVRNRLRDYEAATPDPAPPGDEVS